MPIWKEVIVTPHLLASNKNIPKGAKGVQCSKVGCGKFLPLGTKTFRHRRSGGHKGCGGVLTKYYCKECFDSLWI